ncbi:hypothetical protein [Amycolatopsis thailandensis]|nr:hypothetical protein [Amycolatopsis thailandensis]
MTQPDSLLRMLRSIERVKKRTAFIALTPNPQFVINVTNEKVLGGL